MVIALKTKICVRQVRWLMLGGLLCLPACSAPGGLKGQSDHVFSTVSPCDLDSQADRSALPAKAEYPTTTSSSGRPLTTSPTTTQPHSSSSVIRQVSYRPEVDTEGVARVAAPWESSYPDPITRQSESGDSLPSAHSDEFVFASAADPGVVRSRTVLPDGRVVHASEPRQPVGGRGFTLNAPESGAPVSAAAAWPDEYICDGGDRGLPVHYSGVQRRGFETEDTIIEYSDHAGDFQVKAANRVCVYAPRFGSVRSVTGLEADVKFERAAGAVEAVVVENLKSGNAAVQSVQGQNPEQLLDRRHADGVEHSQPPLQAAVADRPEQTRKFDHGQQGRALTNAGGFGQVDVPHTAERLDNAYAWTRDQYPVISASTSSAVEVIAKFRVQQTVGVEDQRKAGTIRIVKLADRAMAQSGDTVTFEIQFHNTGDFPVYDVRIVDNLTPRLEFVPGSASIDEAHPGEVLVEPNGEGSDILTFVLDGPLAGNSSGTIHFEARVR